MDSIIEVQRQTHEEIERFERALATVLSKNQPTQQAKLANEHKAAQLLDRISSRVATLNNAYQDQVARKAEIDALSSSGQTDDLSNFYVRLGKIKEHHLKYPDTVVGNFELELAGLVESDYVEGGDDDYEEEDRTWYTNLEATILFNICIWIYSYFLIVFWRGSLRSLP